MNCPKCKRVVYPNQRYCQCGEKIVSAAPTYRPPVKYAPNTSNIVARKFAEKLAEVNAYVEEYRGEHPGSTKREACLQYMRDKGIISALPKHLQKLDDPEARAEREAIQAE